MSQQPSAQPTEDTSFMIRIVLRIRHLDRLEPLDGLLPLWSQDDAVEAYTQLAHKMREQLITWGVLLENSFFDREVMPTLVRQVKCRPPRYMAEAYFLRGNIGAFLLEYYAVEKAERPEQSLANIGYWITGKQQEWQYCEEQQALLRKDLGQNLRLWDLYGQEQQFLQQLYLEWQRHLWKQLQDEQQGLPQQVDIKRHQAFWDQYNQGQQRLQQVYIESKDNLKQQYIQNLQRLQQRSHEKQQGLLQKHRQKLLLKRRYPPLPSVPDWLCHITGLSPHRGQQPLPFAHAHQQQAPAITQSSQSNNAGSNVQPVRPVKRQKHQQQTPAITQPSQSNNVGSTVQPVRPVKRRKVVRRPDAPDGTVVKEKSTEDIFELE